MLYAVVQQASSSEMQQWLFDAILRRYIDPCAVRDWLVGSPLQGSALRMAKGAPAAALGAHLKTKANVGGRFASRLLAIEVEWEPVFQAIEACHAAVLARPAPALALKASRPIPSAGPWPSRPWAVECRCTWSKS